MAELTSDKNLIKQYLAGDSRSIDVLVDRYLKMIYSFVYKNVGSAPDSEDITQEVFVRVWKNLKKFDQKKSFRPWIFQIAKNASIDFLRKKKTIPLSRFEDDTGHNFLAESLPAPSINIIGNLSDKKTLAVAMQRLNNKEQEIITLRHDSGLSFREISEIFQESVNTIKSRYRRGLINLKKAIGRDPHQNTSS